jgi:hypothetical protein
MPSGPGDLDLTVYGLQKFCRLALNGSPTVLLLLFISGENLLERDEFGEELQALVSAFVPPDWSCVCGLRRRAASWVAR